MPSSSSLSYISSGSMAVARSRVFLVGSPHTPAEMIPCSPTIAGRRHRRPARRRPGDLLELLGDVLTRVLGDEVADERGVLDEMAVAVDHRMVQSGPDGPHVVARRVGHRPSPSAVRPPRTNAPSSAPVWTPPSKATCPETTVVTYPTAPDTSREPPPGRSSTIRGRGRGEGGKVDQVHVGFLPRGEDARGRPAPPGPPCRRTDA